MQLTDLFRTCRVAAAVALVAMFGFACRGGTSQGTGTGVARVVASCGAACPDIARVIVTVSKGDGSPDFPPIIVELTRSGAQWGGRITGIPAGVGRKFDVVAFGADGARLFAGSGKSDIVAGAAAVVSIQLQGPQQSENAFPVVSVSASREFVAPGGTLQAIATAQDPDGDAVVYFWRASCGSFDDPTRSRVTWTAPSAEGPCLLTVTVADNKGAATIASLSIIVTTQLGDAQVSVKFFPVISALTGSVTLGNTMAGDLHVVATSLDADPLTYKWASTCVGLIFDLNPPFSATDPHFTLPGPSPACAVTVTVTTPSVLTGTTATIHLPPNGCVNVSCPAGQVCNAADGTCNAAVCTPNCAGKVCGPDGCTGICGTCATGSCDAGGQCVAACVPSCAGKVCGLDGCGGSCGTCASGSCDASGQCVAACTPNCADKVCGPDGCTGSCGTCATGSCDASGQCVVSFLVPRPQAAKQLTISALNGLAMDTLGAVYVTGPVFGTKSFDAQTVTSVGSGDALVAKYDPVTHSAVWAKAFGGGAPEATGPTDQLPQGGAVTADGTVVIIGNSTGNIVVNPTTTLAIPGLQDFILGVNGTTGAGLWGLTFNNGLGGGLFSITANPARNVFAVCGWTDTVSPLAPAGTVFGGGTRDAIIAMFNSSGTLVWSKQLGSGSDEECDSLAIDDAGDLYVAGQYNSVTGQTNLNPGLGALPSTGLGTRRWLWVAKYNGLSGAAIAQASFGSGNGNHKAFGLAVDAAGKLVMGGSFTFTLPFGATSLTTAGATDGFVAKLDPAAATPFAPMWAVRVGSPTGDQINSVAVTSFGEVLAAGLFSGTTTGAAALTVAGSADALLLKLDGATGATQFSAGYGDASNQAMSNVVANRQGAGAVKDLVEFGGAYAGNIAFPVPAGALPVSIGDSFLVFAPLGP